MVELPIFLTSSMQLTGKLRRHIGRLLNSIDKRRELRSRFVRIHTKSWWQGKESVSGTGSDAEQTEFLRRELPTFLRALGVRTLLDAPCGDLNWIQHTELQIDRYIGADIVPAIINANRARFVGSGRTFVLADVCSDALPRADAILCRDCLVHLSYTHIAAALVNFARTGAEFLITTTFPDEANNRDIDSGGWRPLNLELPPFAFGPPVARLIEGCTEVDAVRAYTDKSLAAWKIAELPVFGR